MIYYVIFLALLPLVIGFLIADTKGKSVELWLIVIAFTSWIGIIALSLSPNEKLCPDCQKRSNEEAKVCGYCGHKFKVVDQKISHKKEEIIPDNNFL